jgi:hypothetical protein
VLLLDPQAIGCMFWCSISVTTRRTGTVCRQCGTVTAVHRAVVTSLRARLQWSTRHGLKTSCSIGAPAAILTKSMHSRYVCTVHWLWTAQSWTGNGSVVDCCGHGMFTPRLRRAVHTPPFCDEGPSGQPHMSGSGSPLSRLNGSAFGSFHFQDLY